MPNVTTEQKIAALYVAYFGRAPDKAGFELWQTQIAGGTADFATISSEFSAHPVFHTTYGGMDNRAFVEAIYTNTLGGQGDQAGIADWTTALDTGTSRSDMVSAFLESALTIDLDALLDAGQLARPDYDAAVLRQQYLTNRADMGVSFVEKMGAFSNVQDALNPTSDPAYLASINIMRDVDANAASLVQAQAQLDAALRTSDPAGALTGNTPTQVDTYKATPLWTLEGVGLQSPESVAYDAATGKLYVSNVNGSNAVKDGNGFISEISSAGELIDLQKFAGLNDPLGLVVSNGTLFAADRDELVAINLTTGQKTAYSVAGAGRLNDVVADSQGNIYVSDFLADTAAVYKLPAGGSALEKLHQDFAATPRPNGLEVVGNQLYIGSFDDSGKVTVIDLATGNVTAGTPFGHAIDGLKSDGAGNLLASDFYGQVSVLNGEGEVNQILATVTSAADIEYIASQNLLLVPTLSSQSVSAYSLEAVLI